MFGCSEHTPRLFQLQLPRLHGFDLIVVCFRSSPAVFTVYNLAHDNLVTITVAKLRLVNDRLVAGCCRHAKVFVCFHGRDLAKHRSSIPYNRESELRMVAASSGGGVPSSKPPPGKLPA